MPEKLTIRCGVSDDGHLPKTRRRQIASTLKLYAGGEVQITIGRPKRSTKANSYYWGVVLKAIQLGCAEAGLTATNTATGEVSPITQKMLHRMFKDRYLDVRAVEIAGQGLTMEPTTTRLDQTEFSHYLDCIREDPFVLALGVDWEAPLEKYRSYTIAEPA